MFSIDFFSVFTSKQSIKGLLFLIVNHDAMFTLKVVTCNILEVFLTAYDFVDFQLAVVSRSEYLNRLVFQRGSSIQIDNLPGGKKTFELVVKFCYGWKFNMTASNIVSLYCAAHFLEMSEDIEEENLISKTEAFLSYLILSSWKDTLRILKSCESIPHWAKELHIVKHCSEAIALKAASSCFSFDENAESKGKTNNNSSGLESTSRVDDAWWFKDVSLLRIDHFIEVVQSIKRRGIIKSELVGSCIEYWTTKWFSQVTLGLDNKVAPKHMTLQLRKVSTECLVSILPTEENSVTCNFLLHLLKAGVMLKINPELLCVLETRVASMLEQQCRVPDLLVKNQGDEDSYSLYDVDVVVRVLQSYVRSISGNNIPDTVGRLVDGYLTQVARDQKLTVESFKSLVEALPQNARYYDDNLYRAIDMYLKVNSFITFISLLNH